MKRLLFLCLMLVGLIQTSCFDGDPDDDGVTDQCNLIFWTDKSPANFDVYINNVYKGTVSKSHDIMALCGQTGTVDIFYNEASIEVNYVINRNGEYYTQGTIYVSGCTKIKL